MLLYCASSGPSCSRFGAEEIQPHFLWFFGRAVSSGGVFVSCRMPIARRWLKLAGWPLAEVKGEAAERCGAPLNPATAARRLPFRRRRGRRQGNIPAGPQSLEVVRLFGVKVKIGSCLPVSLLYGMLSCATLAASGQELAVCVRGLWWLLKSL